MKKFSNLRIILCLFLGFLALEVVILSRQNMTLKKQLYLMKAMSEKKKRGIAEGTIVPPIKGLTYEGEKFTIKYDNKKTLLFVFSRSCPQCLKINSQLEIYY